jgi:hypothetical protein
MSSDDLPLLLQFKEGQDYIRLEYSKDRCPSCKGKMPSALAMYIHPKCYQQNTKYYIARSHDKKAVWKCNRCNLQFNTHSELHDHYEVHLTEKEKIYECLQCHIRFGRRLNIQKHLLIDHAIKITQSNISLVKEWREKLIPLPESKDSSHSKEATTAQPLHLPKNCNFTLHKERQHSILSHTPSGLLSIIVPSKERASHVSTLFQHYKPYL